jgi:hypothetical protein
VSITAVTAVSLPIPLPCSSLLLILIYYGDFRSAVCSILSLGVLEMVADVTYWVNRLGHQVYLQLCFHHAAMGLDLFGVTDVECG